MEVNPLLDRYLRGDRIHVWSELVQLGGSIGRDAESVVEEVGRRIRHNVVVLTERLLGMGYQFYRQEGGYRFADAESLAQLEEAQRNWGRFPRLLSRIYQDFAWVDFSQADGQISAGEFRGMGWHPQLYLLSMPECAVLRETMREEAEHAAECMRRYCQNSGEVYHEETGSLNCVFTGPCASNNDMKGFALPCDAVDARYYDDGGGPTLFYSELSDLFSWGGFPELGKYIVSEWHRDRWGMPHPERILEQLVEGLEPL